MSIDKFVETGSSGFGKEYTLEQIQAMCNEDETAMKTCLKLISETMKYLSVIGVNCNNLNLRTFYPVFYSKNDIDEQHSYVLDSATPVEDFCGVDFKITNIQFENDKQAEIYYEYIDRAIDKHHYVSFSKFSQLLKMANIDVVAPSFDTIGKNDTDFYDINLQINQQKKSTR